MLVLYGLVVLPRDKTYDVLLVNSWCAAENLGYLLVIYAHKWELKKVSIKISFFCLFRINIVFWYFSFFSKGIFIFTTSVICITGALLLFQIDLSSNATKSLKYLFDWTGNALLLWGHFAQIRDLVSVEQKSVWYPFHVCYKLLILYLVLNMML